MTQEKLTQTNCPISTLYAEDSLVKAFQSLEKGAALTMQEELSSLKLPELPPSKKPKYLLLENVPGLLSHNCLSFARRAGRLRPSSVRWMIALALHGRYDVVWEVLNSADFSRAELRQYPNPEKRVYIIGFHREKCSGKVLSFTDANPKTLVKKNFRQRGKQSIFSRWTEHNPYKPSRRFRR